MFVIDQAPRFPQLHVVLTHDQILDELREQIRSGKFTQKWVATVLGIAPSRVNEVLKGGRRIQPAEMPKLADLLGLSNREEQPVTWLPRDTTLEELLRAATPFLSASPVDEEALQVAAHMIGAALRHFAKHPDLEDSPAGVKGVIVSTFDGVASQTFGKALRE